jgi:pimeloyl-ACP methyl ester carboxylesterase
MYHFFTQTKNSFPDYSKVHKELAVPILLLWGEKDSMLKIQNQLSLIKSNFPLKDENIHLFQVSHLIQEEIPELLCEKIDSFLLSQ